MKPVSSGDRHLRRVSRKMLDACSKARTDHRNILTPGETAVLDQIVDAGNTNKPLHSLWIQRAELILVGLKNGG